MTLEKQEEIFNYITANKYLIPEGMTLIGLIMLEFDLNKKEAQELIIEYFSLIR